MLTQVVVWLNHIANAIGGFALAPVAWVPGWLSATIMGIVIGILMLVVFKHTSNQAAIKRTRDKIKANMLALSLFKDDLRVSLRCQARLLVGAVMLMVHALFPMAVMTIPMVLILGQMSLWYQARPLTVGEESLVTVTLKESASDGVDSIELVPSDSSTVVAGPVRVRGKHFVCWNVAPTTGGGQDLQFKIDDKLYSKQFSVGSGFQPTSLKRPSGNLSDMLLHPREAPFASDSIVQAIEIDYPQRNSFTSGTNNWVIYWFIVSMLAAILAKPFLNVNI